MSSSRSSMLPPFPCEPGISRTSKDQRASTPRTALTAGAFAFATPPSAKGKKAARPIGSFTPFGSLGSGSSPAGKVKVEPADQFAHVKASVTASARADACSRDETPLRAVSDTSSSFSLPPPGQRPRQHPSPSQSFCVEPPTPSGLNTIKVKHDAVTPRKTATATPRKLSALSSFSSLSSFGTSPFRTPKTEAEASDGGSMLGKRRRLGDIGYAIPAIPANVTGKTKAKVIEGKTVGLRAVNDTVRLEEIDIEEMDAKRGREEVEVELGVGISPRKGKVKWNGRGDPPLSMRLAQLTSTESASLTLFYTSLYHTLNPGSAVRTPAKRSRVPANGNTKAGVEEPPAELAQPSKAISALSHIRTAPIRLVLTRPASGRMHAAHLWRAEVVRWPRAAIHSLSRDSLTEARQAEGDPPTEILVNLAIPSNSAGTRSTGTDPRVVEERWRAEAPPIPGLTAGQSDLWVDDGRELVSTWEVGVWSEWSIMDVCLDGQSGGQAAKSPGVSPEESEVAVKVLFATRYLVAEGKLRE